MNCVKVGEVIRLLRSEKGMTQKQLAEKMNLSDKTVSKWERGLGCPDVSLLTELSKILDVDISTLLSGELSADDFTGGNMKNTKFYVCPQCGNVTLCTGNAGVVCCGRKLEPLAVKKADGAHLLSTENVEDERFITSSHPMQKDHYISFIALASGEKVQIFKQYPEWNIQLRLPKSEHGKLLWYCTEHGLYFTDI